MNKMTTRFYANKDHHRPKAAGAPQRGLGEALTLHMMFHAHPEADLQPSAWFEGCQGASHRSLNPQRPETAQALRIQRNRWDL